MKNIKWIFMLMLGLALGFTSCDDDFSQPPVNVPEGGIGSGAWNNPMTAYQALIGTVNEEQPTPWVTGYIVGYVDTEEGTVLNERTARFTTPATINTNMLIALNPDETNWENCATVQLPSGAARTALNLVDNPGNLGKQVTIKGTTGSKYCGVYGVRSVSDYNWGDQGIQEEPEGPVESLGAFFEDFDSSNSFSTYSVQGWKNVSVLGGLSGWYIKNYDNTNYVTVSAYFGSETGGPYEIWLITPPVGIDKLSQKTVQFQTQAAYPAEGCTLEVYVMTSDDPTASVNTLLPAAIAEAPASNYSTWVDSGLLDLSQFSGDIYIGWRYYSPKGGIGFSSTFCIDNISVGGATAAGN